MRHKLYFRQIVFFFFLIFSRIFIFGEENPFPIDELDLSQGPVYSVLGWGEEGKLAFWSAVPASKSRKSPYIRFYVRDLVDDIYLYQSRIINLKNTNDWILAADTLQRDWRTIKKRFGLENNNYSSEDKEFTFLGSNYEVYLDTEAESLAEGLKSWALYMRINQKRLKLIQAFMKKRSQTEKLRSIAIKEVLISPLEKRSAIVLLLTWENEGRAWSELLFCGSHLTLGFETPRTDNSLTEAVLNGQFYVTRLLLEKGANPDGDGSGVTPLEYAFQYELWDIANLLLEKGADPDRYRSKPLIKTAVDKRQWDLVRLMIQKGADTSSIQGVRIPE